MTIVLGADHAGYTLKETIKNHIKEKDEEVIDVGTFSEDSVDYPLFAVEVCEKIKTQEASLGILVCGSGVGMSIAANRFPFIRAVLGCNASVVQASKKHNNTNVLCLGARFTPVNEALEIVEAFLSTSFEGERHQKRVDMLSSLQG